MESGGPTHVHRDPTVAAGRPPINTVGPPGLTIGPPTWGTGGTAGVAIGQTCISVIRAAGIIMRVGVELGNNAALNTFAEF
jgi:hypothetical protein